MNYKFEPICRRMEWLDPFYKAVWEKAFADAIPISGTFELTPRCNFNCRMCYVHLQKDQIPKYGRELTAKEWIRIAQDAKESGTTWLCITGGEPLMHPEFMTIWKELSQMGFFITLQTNASLINGKMIKLMDQYPPRKVKITLYGSNNKVYSKVCGIKNGFDRVDIGIRNLFELCIPIELVSTIIRQNEEDMAALFEYAKAKKIPWSFTRGIKLSLRGSINSAKEDRIYQVDRMSKEDKKRILELSPMDIRRKPCTYCKDYRLGYWLTWNGKMRFCSFMNEPNISILDKPFQVAWNELVEYEENLMWPKECEACSVQNVCMRCVGGLASESGGIYKVNSMYCNTIKAMYGKDGK